LVMAVLALAVDVAVDAAVDAAVGRPGPEIRSRQTT
jgi:hypothetical protein